MLFFLYNIYYFSMLLFATNNIYYFINKSELEKVFNERRPRDFNVFVYLYYILSVVSFLFVFLGLFSNLYLFFGIILTLWIAKFPLYHISKPIYSIYSLILPIIIAVLYFSVFMTWFIR